MIGTFFNVCPSCNSLRAILCSGQVTKNVQIKCKDMWSAENLNLSRLHNRRCLCKMVKLFCFNLFFLGVFRHFSKHGIIKKQSWNVFMFLQAKFKYKMSICTTVSAWSQLLSINKKQIINKEQIFVGNWREYSLSSKHLWIINHIHCLGRAESQKTLWFVVQRCHYCRDTRLSSEQPLPP